MIFLPTNGEIIGMMQEIINNGGNMEAAGSAGVAVNSKNIGVMSASESKNMYEVQTAMSDDDAVSDWELEEEESSPVSMKAAAEWDEEMALEEEQMAAVRKAQAKALAAREEIERKQKANHDKQMKQNVKRASSKPKLEMGNFAWLTPLVTAQDSKITQDSVFRGFSKVIQARVMELVSQSRETINIRTEKAELKISAIGYDGGGEGDDTEGQIITSQSKKMVERLAMTWRTTMSEAKEVAASLTMTPVVKVAPVESPVAKAATPVEKPVQMPESPVKSKELAAEIMEGFVVKSQYSPSVCGCERDEGFDIMAKAKAQAKSNPAAFTCSRPCEEFKTGRPCRHRAAGRVCNWGHALDNFVPKKCAWPTSCNKWQKKSGACECAHVIDGVLETPRQVMERLLSTQTLKKPLPETEKKVVVEKSAAVGVVTAQMTADEKRAVARKHREQLDRLNKKDEPVQQLRQAVVEPTKTLPPTKTNVWAKPPIETVEDTIVAKPAEEKAKDMASTKPLLRCTPEMAIQMLELMQKTGMDTGSVTFEIIS